jgi:hypothetical protein
MHPRKREFINLFNASGWSKAELARHLRYTRGGIQTLLEGPSVPTEATLKLLKLVLLSEKPEALRAVTPNEPLLVADSPQEYKAWSDDLMGDLADIEPRKREELVAAIRHLLRVARKVDLAD